MLLTILAAGNRSALAVLLVVTLQLQRMGLGLLLGEVIVLGARGDLSVLGIVVAVA